MRGWQQEPMTTAARAWWTQVSIGWRTTKPVAHKVVMDRLLGVVSLDQIPVMPHRRIASIQVSFCAWSFDGVDLPPPSTRYQLATLSESKGVRTINPWNLVSLYLLPCAHRVLSRPICSISGEHAQLPPVQTARKNATLAQVPALPAINSRSTNPLDQQQSGDIATYKHSSDEGRWRSLFTTIDIPV